MKTCKAIALILVLGLLTFVLCGCVQTVSVTAYTDKNGGVHREYLITYDPEDADAESVKNEIVTVMNRYVEKHEIGKYSTVDAEKEGEVCLKVVFPSVDEYYAQLGYTGREANEVNTSSKTGFFNAYDTKVDSYLKEENVKEIRSLLDEEFKDIPLTAEFYYTYGTPNRSTVSNGEQSKKDGIYYHTWKLDPDGSSDMVIRTYGINLFAMYGVAILIFVLSLAIVFGIIKYNRKKDKLRAEATRGNPAVFGELTSEASEEKKE